MYKHNILTTSEQLHRHTSATFAKHGYIIIESVMKTFELNIVQATHTAFCMFVHALIQYARRFLIYILFFIFLTCPLCHVFSQTFTATVSPQKIGKNQYIELTYEVAGASTVGHFQPPPLKEWAILTGPNSGSYISNINGKVSRRFSFSYYLQPKRTGKLTIESAQIIADGKLMNSNTTTVDVLNKTVQIPQSQSSTSNDPLINLMDDPFSPPGQQKNYQDMQNEEEAFAMAQLLQPNEDINRKISESVLLKINTDKTSCYEGEPIVATYKIYTRLNLENLHFEKRPSFSGFSAYDLEEPNQHYTIETLNGKKYKVYIFRRVQLYPLRSGTLTLDPVEIDFNVKLIKYEAVKNSGYFNSNDPSNYIEKNFILKNSAINIQAFPFPATGRPADFKNVTGTFSITGSIDNNEIGKDEAGTLRIKISGNGNLYMIQPPTVRWPSNVEGYDPQEKENVNKIAVPVSGEKIFTYPFLCHTPGSYTIAPVQFSYFDPVAKTYKTIVTKTISFTVLNERKKNKEVTEPAQKNWPVIFVHITKIALPILAAGLIIYLFIAFVIRRKKNIQGTSKKKEGYTEKIQSKKEDAITHLIMQDNDEVTSIIQAPKEKHFLFSTAEATLSVPDHTVFYQSLKNDFIQAVSMLIYHPIQNKNTLAKQLLQKGIEHTLINRFISLLELCEAAIYSPVPPNADRQKTLDEAKCIIQEINSALFKFS